MALTSLSCSQVIVGWKRGKRFFIVKGWGKD